MDEFLIITYTKAAASELRGKSGAKLTEVLAANPGNRHLQRQVQRLYLAKISTVHSFCGDLLREYAFALELPGDFRVADETECQSLRQRAMEEILEAAYENISGSPQLQALWIPRALAGTTMRCRRLWRLSMRQPGAISGRMPGWRAV